MLNQEPVVSAATTGNTHRPRGYSEMTAARSGNCMAQCHPTNLGGPVNPGSKPTGIPDGVDSLSELVRDLAGVPVAQGFRLSNSRLGKFAARMPQALSTALLWHSVNYQ